MSHCYYGAERRREFLLHFESVNIIYEHNNLSDAHIIGFIIVVVCNFTNLKIIFIYTLLNEFTNIVCIKLICHCLIESNFV